MVLVKTYVALTKSAKRGSAPFGIFLQKMSDDEFDEEFQWGKKRVTSHPLRLFHCNYCGVNVTTRDPHQRYCCHHCAYKAKKVRQQKEHLIFSYIVEKQNVWGD